MSSDHGVSSAPVSASASVPVPAPDAFVGSALALVPFALAAGVEARLLIALVAGDGPLADPRWWLGAHVLASVTAAGATTALVVRLSGDRPRRLFALCLGLGLAMPFVGAIGTGGALLLGFRHAIRRHREVPYWRVTERPALPYTPPRGRRANGLDGRGFAEQLAHDGDTDALYRKVLAAGRMPSALSVDALTSAVRHPDERIRLTAYQTLDRKVSRLNAEIQRLEADAEDRARDGHERSDTWLQIAGNYWELLTLEQGEPVAREQLLGKAAGAALRAIVIRPDNRNAHFTLGRVALRQGEPARARVAFERATALGMPLETTRPYLAEAAFDAREFGRIAPLLAGIDDAFAAYPPLADVVEQWR